MRWWFLYHFGPTGLCKGYFILKDEILAAAKSDSFLYQVGSSRKGSGMIERDIEEDILSGSSSEVSLAFESIVGGRSELSVGVEVVVDFFVDFLCQKDDFE